MSYPNWTLRCYNSHTYRDIWYAAKNKTPSVLNLLKQRQVCRSSFFQFNMRISVIYGTLSVSCKRVVRVLSPLASNSCGGSHLGMLGHFRQQNGTLEINKRSVNLPCLHLPLLTYV